MKLQMIFGLIVTIFCAICATLLIWKYLKINAERDERDRNAKIMQTENIIHDNFRVAFEEEYERRKDVEFRLKVTQRELKRARELLALAKLSEVEK